MTQPAVWDPKSSGQVPPTMQPKLEPAGKVHLTTSAGTGPNDIALAVTASAATRSFLRSCRSAFLKILTGEVAGTTHPLMPQGVYLRCLGQQQHRASQQRAAGSLGLNSKVG